LAPDARVGLTSGLEPVQVGDQVGQHLIDGAPVGLERRVADRWTVWCSTPNRSAIGCIDLRLPSNINPRRYSSPFARWSDRASPPSISPANASSRGLTWSISSGVTSQDKIT
jgi:hypothetical protein